MLRAVFFDVGNTLLYPYPSVAEVCRQVLEDAGHARELSAIDEIMPLVDQYYEDRYREDDSFWTDEAQTSAVWVGMYGLLCRALGIEDDEAERLAMRVYNEFGESRRWRAFDDVAPALARLKARGLGLGIISNWDSRLVRLVNGLGLGEYLDVVISSADVGLHKPNPRIFDLACGHIGVTPTEAVHVGDHYYADVLGAEAVGMTAVLIDRHCGEPPSFPRFLRTLDDLDGVLASRGG